MLTQLYSLLWPYVPPKPEHVKHMPWLSEWPLELVAEVLKHLTPADIINLWASDPSTSALIAYVGCLRSWDGDVFVDFAGADDFDRYLDLRQLLVYNARLRPELLVARIHASNAAACLPLFKGHACSFHTGEAVNTMATNPRSHSVTLWLAFLTLATSTASGAWWYAHCSLAQ